MGGGTQKTKVRKSEARKLGRAEVQKFKDKKKVP